jgi:sucrose-6-phosphate hydrolase SacC (GH32 family)
MEVFLCAAGAMAGLMISGAAVAEGPDLLYNESYRPQFHFSPKKNWTNDPNGPIHRQAPSIPMK